MLLGIRARSDVDVKQNTFTFFLQYDWILNYGTWQTCAVISELEPHVTTQQVLWLTFIIPTIEAVLDV